MDEIQANGELWISRTKAASMLNVHPSSLTRCMDAELFWGVRELRVGTNKLINKTDFETAAAQYVKRNVWTKAPKRGQTKKFDGNFQEALDRRLPDQEELLSAIRGKDINYLRQWRISRGN